MVTVHPDRAYPKCKHSHMNFRACVQLPLDTDGIDSSINRQMLKTPHDLRVHLSDLENGRNPEIGTLNTEKGDIF